MSVPDLIDVDGLNGPWPGFTISGLTGADSYLGNYYLTYDEGGSPYYAAFIASTHSFVHVVGGIWAVAFGNPGSYSDLYTANAAAEWPWQVTSWTSAPGSAGGSPIFTYLPIAPLLLPVSGATAGLVAFPAEASVNSMTRLASLIPGADGQAIRYKQAKAVSPNTPIDIFVHGNDITITLGTDGSGNSNSTAAQVANQINIDPSASELVVATAMGNGTGIATVISDFVHLTAGQGPGPASPNSLPITGAATPVAATFTTIGDTASNAKALLTAVISGRIGNSIRYQQVNPMANNAAASVIVNGLDITLNLATGPAGAITTTGTQRNALLNASLARQEGRCRSFWIQG